MGSDTPRWVLVFVLACCVLALAVWARGPVHHHGRYVGSLVAVHSQPSGERSPL